MPHYLGPTANPGRDADNWLLDQDNLLRRRPRCSECEEHIQDDILYEFDDKLICKDCLDLNHRRYTDEFI